MSKSDVNYHSRIQLSRRDFEAIAPVFGFTDTDSFIRFVQEQDQREMIRVSARIPGVRMG